MIVKLHKDALGCNGGELLHAYFIGLIFLLVLSIFMTVLVVFNSMSGTITNFWPRRRMSKLIYIKLAISLPELAWNIMGTYWAFGKSSGCEAHVVMIVKGAVITGWVIGLIVVIGIAVVFDPLGALHPIQGQQDSQGKEMAAAAAMSAKRVWERRLTDLESVCKSLRNPIFILNIVAL